MNGFCDFCMSKRIVLLIAAIQLLAFQTGCKSHPVQTPEATEVIVESSDISTEDSTEATEGTPEPSYGPFTDEIDDSELVRVKTYIPDIIVELKYATTDNFTGEKIYEFSDAYLRYGTVKKLAEVQKELRADGMGLKIWDAFRPVSAQFRLWEVCPDATYVANPNNGFSSHSRGNTVDVTLVLIDGSEIQMPTGFDDFTHLANRDYSDCDATAANNAIILENMMIEYGFNAYSGEWWHYSDTDRYDVEKSFVPDS